MTNAAPRGKSDAGNPRVRLDEVEAAPCTAEATLQMEPRRRRPAVIHWLKATLRSKAASVASASGCEDPRRGSLLYTIFTSWKRGEGRVAEIQHAALANWKECFVGANIVEVGEGRDFSQFANGEQVEANAICAWINADILFDRAEVRRLREWMDAQAPSSAPWLIVGRRIDLLPGGQREVHRPSGMDYFFFRAGTFRELPSTIMGRAYCDSALLAYGLRRGLRVIDASEVLTAIHQWHDYGHVVGGRQEVFAGNDAMANRRNNQLRDFGPHIADIRLKFKLCRKSDRTELGVVKKRVPMLRRLGLWGWWNLVTRGGIGFWGFHVYTGKSGAQLVTRSKIERWPANSPLLQIFALLGELPRAVYSGFDFPSMWKAWRLAKAERMRWIVFLWDPPALSHRDGCAALRWGIDAAWRWFARRCDRIVLHIHPGLLQEMGYRAKAGQVIELTNGVERAVLENERWRIGIEQRVKGRIGVVAQNLEQSREKGVRLAEMALQGENIDWIGGVSREEAMQRIASCEIMLLPYPPSYARKWNYPLKLFEYLALGGKIVACDNPGVRAVIQEGVNGFLYRAGDAASLRAAIARARQTTDGGVEARARATAQQYVWEDINRRMLEELRS